MKFLLAIVLALAATGKFALEESQVMQAQPTSPLQTVQWLSTEP